MRASSKRLRQELLEHLGGCICNICGFTDIRALQVDHIFGGGCKEIKKFKGNNKMYKAILELPVDVAREKYQVLCANCNRIKVYKSNEFKKTNYTDAMVESARSEAIAEAVRETGNCLRKYF